MVSPQTKLDLSFAVDVVQDGTVTRVPFKSLLGKRTVVSVYMRNNTSACDKQVEALVKEAKTLGGKGVTLIAVSRDKASSHLKYAEKKGVTFALVSDPEDLFSKAADAIVEKSMYGKKYLGPARAAYLLDGSGKVLQVIPKIEAAKHGEEVCSLVA